MTLYALVTDGVVTGICSPVAGKTLEQTPGLTAEHIASAELIAPGGRAEVGWKRIDTGTFAPPEKTVPLTLVQRATAALHASLAITCANTPALDASYPLSGDLWKDLKDEAQFVTSFGSFSSDAPTITFALSPSQSVTFTAPAQLLAVVKAVGIYIRALKTIISTNTGTLPEASVKI